jgi:Family of unknown function (DUF6941)
MKLSVAILADSAIANPQDGKLYLLGGGISTIGVPGFPAMHPALSLAVGIEYTPSECSRDHHLEVRLIDPDGRDLTPTLKRDGAPQRNPADPTAPVLWLTVFNYMALQFGKPADNAFSIVLDGQEIDSLPLRVIQIPQAIAA